MNARLPEIDLGILSREEAAMRPTRSRYEEAELNWLYFALDLARGARIRVARLTPDTGDWYAERYAQDMARAAAKLHASNLIRSGYTLTADAVAFMKREGAV